MKHLTLALLLLAACSSTKTQPAADYTVDNYINDCGDYCSTEVINNFNDIKE